MSVECFVVGCSRSGTTLLSVLLDRHTQVAVPPETAFYRDLAARFKDADGERARAILSTWHRLPELGLDPDAVIEACAGDYASQTVMASILSLYAAARDKAHCGEKTPGHFRSVGPILADFPDAKVLFLMRDGRDAALSLTGMPFWKGGLVEAANLWINAARTARELLASRENQVLLVRYEDLAARPKATLDRIMPALGLSFEIDQLDPHVASGVVLARSMDWKGRAMATVDTSRIGHWRSTASDEDATYLNSAMRSELEHFGYTV